MINSKSLRRTESSTAMSATALSSWHVGGRRLSRLVTLVLVVVLLYTFFRVFFTTDAGSKKGLSTSVSDNELKRCRHLCKAPRVGKVTGDDHGRTLILVVPWADPAWKRSFRQGGPGGEVVWLESLQATCEHIGWTLEVIDNRRELLDRLAPFTAQYFGKDPPSDERRAEIKRSAPVIFVGQFMWDVVEHIGTKRFFEDFEVYVLAWFGISPIHHVGVNSSRALTAFPTHAINTFLGIHFDPSRLGKCFEAKRNEFRKDHRLRGLVWGKETRYFMNKRGLLEQLISNGDVDLYLTVSDSKDWTVDGNVHGGYDELIPQGVTNLGVMSKTKWLDTLCKTHFIVGLGDPVAGPSPMELIAMGGLYFNPHYLYRPIPIHGDRNLVVTTQHPYLSSISSRTVCDFDLDDVTQIDACVKLARKTFTGLNVDADDGVRKEEFEKVIAPFTLESQAQRLREILDV